MHVIVVTGPHGAVAAPRARAGGPRRSGHLLPGRGRRRRRRATGCATCRSSSSSRGRRSRRSSAEGYEPNVYVDDELYVARITPEAEALRELPAPRDPSRSATSSRGSTATPTKLVCVGDPAALDELAPRLRERFGERLHVTKSLPYFLELATAGVTKGSGLDFLADHLGFTPEQTIAFGDGENDVELLEWAGYGVAVENAHERVKAVADWICPPAAEEGVAAVLEALVHSRP